MRIVNTILFDKVTAVEKPVARRKMFGFGKQDDIYTAVIKSINASSCRIAIAPEELHVNDELMALSGECIIDRYGCLRSGKVLCRHISEETVLSDVQIKRLGRWINEEDTPEN